MTKPISMYFNVKVGKTWNQKSSKFSFDSKLKFDEHF